MVAHIVQSQEWGEFKTAYGTEAVRVEGIQYTKHPIPFTDKFFAYCPKVDPFLINFDAVKESLLKNNCVNINFDVPNITKDDHRFAEAAEVFKTHECVLSPRDQFAKSNILLDLTPETESLLARMYHKHRYNIRYAERNGVKLRKGVSSEDFEMFWDLYEPTSVRQHYYIRPKKYYQTIIDYLSKKNMVEILTVIFEDKPLASWMVFKFESILYYPYGGSSQEHKNLHASTYLGWEAILYGKEQGCSQFDMWGAADDPADKSDPWWGFTNFKLKYGGRFVSYMDSYDFVVNPSVYKFFTAANDLRWKVLKLIK